MDEFAIENVILSARVADTLDLTQVAKTFPDSKYNPDETPAVILHKIIPTTSVLMFLANGTILSTGAKSVQDAETLIRSTHKMLHTAGIPVIENPTISIQTLIASHDLNTKLNLRKLAKRLSSTNVEYNPKQFPGLVYKTNDHNTIVLLFDSGKIICQGPTMEQVSNALQSMKNTLSSNKII